MTERDMTANPYTPDEQRAVDYLIKITKGLVGAGDDPIGFLIASHNYLRDMHTYDPGSRESIRARMNFTMHSGDLGKRDAALLWYYGTPGYALSVGPEGQDDDPPPEFLLLLLAIIMRADDPAWRKDMLAWYEKQPKKT